MNNPGQDGWRPTDPAPNAPASQPGLPGQPDPTQWEPWPAQAVPSANEPWAAQPVPSANQPWPAQTPAPNGGNPWPAQPTPSASEPWSAPAAPPGRDPWAAPNVPAPTPAPWAQPDRAGGGSWADPAEFQPAEQPQVLQPEAPISETFPVQQPMESPGPLPIRRGRAQSRLLPPVATAEDDKQVIIGRSLLSSHQDRKPQTSRERKIAGSLPDWDPLPPGELLVRRPR